MSMIKNNYSAINKSVKTDVRGAYYTKVLNTHLLSYNVHEYIKDRLTECKLYL